MIILTQVHSSDVEADHDIMSDRGVERQMRVYEQFHRKIGHSLMRDLQQITTSPQDKMHSPQRKAAPAPISLQSSINQIFQPQQHTFAELGNECQRSTTRYNVGDLHGSTGEDDSRIKVIGDQVKIPYKPHSRQKSHKVLVRWTYAVCIVSIMPAV